MTKIGILGPLGTFTEVATQKYLDENGLNLEIVVFPTIQDVFRAVKLGDVDEGVVPIENYLRGNVIDTLDELYETNLQIKKAVVLPINHNFVALENVNEIKKIISHPQALAQCSKFLEENYPNIPKIVATSTAAAMKKIKDEDDLEAAAIGSVSGAEKYNLKIIKENVGNNKINMTRFVIISKNGAERTGNDRTSMILSPKTDRPGLLKCFLDAFAEEDINLEMIQSRPDGLGHYMFYIDFRGHPEDDKIKRVFNKIQTFFGRNDLIKILGTYPFVSFNEESKKIK